MIENIWWMNIMRMMRWTKGQFKINILHLFLFTFFFPVILDNDPKKGKEGKVEKGKQREKNMKQIKLKRIKVNKKWFFIFHQINSEHKGKLFLFLTFPSHHHAQIHDPLEAKSRCKNNGSVMINSNPGVRLCWVERCLLPPLKSTCSQLLLNISFHWICNTIIMVHLLHFDRKGEKEKSWKFCWENSTQEKPENLTIIMRLNLWVDELCYKPFLILLNSFVFSSKRYY